MPSNTYQADRRMGQLAEDIDRARGPASVGAKALNDVGLLRSTLERLSEVLKADTGEPVRLAVQIGRAKEAIGAFDEATAAIRKLADLQAQRDKIKPMTTAAAADAILEGE